LRKRICLKIVIAIKDSNKILTVCLITYNHNSYINKALDSITFQKTDFDFDIIIADDFSTDGTRDEIRNFARKESNTTLFLQSKNVGPAKNFIDLISRPKTKYISYLEGDDYWTDPYKLQKQVDYLDANPDCSFCFTDCQVDRKKTLQEIHPNIKEKRKFVDIDFADQPGSVAQTCTWLVRRECIQNLPNWVTNSYTADWCMQLHFTNFGKGGYLPENTANYRIHENGVWSKLDSYEGWRKNLEFYKTAKNKLKKQSSRKRLKKRIRNTIIDALELANIQANETEIRNWLPQKFITCPFMSMKQTLHSIRLLLT
jgi:glycosyltransferase involved in cell wall biosynthesis